MNKSYLGDRGQAVRSGGGWSEKGTNPWDHADDQSTSWKFSMTASLFLTITLQAGQLAKTTRLCHSTADHMFILFSRRPENSVLRHGFLKAHLRTKTASGMPEAMLKGNTQKAQVSMLYWIYNVKNICSSLDICIAIKIILYGIIINGLKRHKQYKQNIADTMKM